MRRRLIAAAAVAAVLLAVALLLRPDTGADDGSAGALAARTVDAGEIDVRIEPHHIDTTGAVFDITLDTHAVELDMDLSGDARLVVDGVEWPVEGWSGDGPSGHHREGRLAFQPVSGPSGEVRLELNGFEAPVSATWSVDEG